MAQHISGIAQSLYWHHDESELVTDLQAGSDQAFEWLVTYFHASVYNLVHGILSDPADAADVTQEVFLRAFKGIGGFRRGSSLKTWLYRISVREALNHRRWCWRHHRGQVSIDDDHDGAPAVAELRDLDATPFEQLATHETQAVVRRALNEVPQVFRSAVILRDLEGLSYEEISEILEVSVGTVKSRILRGRRHLREILDPLLHASHTHSGHPHPSRDSAPAVPASPRLAPPSASPSAALPQLSLAACENLGTRQNFLGPNNVSSNSSSTSNLNPPEPSGAMLPDAALPSGIFEGLVGGEE
jgi:RNA polymerase sigma-70 factor, ECF subfamily